LRADDDGVTAHLLATRPWAPSRTRRLTSRPLTTLWRLARRLQLLAPTCAIARRPSPDDDPRSLTDELLHRWASWSLGPTPRSLSCLMLTGGRSRLNKVVVLVFADGEDEPRGGVKLARVPESEGALRREVSALRRVADRPVPVTADIPRVVFCDRLAGTLAVGETPVTGQPISTVLTADVHRKLALRVTDLVATLGLDGAPVAPVTYWERLVEPVLGDFRARFGVVNADAHASVRQALLALPSLTLVAEHRDCSPWNVLVTDDDKLALLDWESAEPEGLPLLDLVYYLSHATFFVDRTLGSGGERASYARLLDATSNSGRVFAEAIARYCAATGLDASAVDALRRFTWMVHAGGEHDRIMAVHPELEPDEAARRSLFLQLWLEDVGRER
jgi:hypothetical protein